MTKEEYVKIKEDPEAGVAFLKEATTAFKDEYIITLPHHENDDGTGYPHGLKGEEIHIYGKTTRIKDAYDALNTNRTFAQVIRAFAALLEMKEKISLCFDTELLKEVYTFFRILRFTYKEKEE